VHTVTDSLSQSSKRLVGLDEDVPVVRAAYWAPARRIVLTDLVLIEADWGDPDLAEGGGLLCHMRELAARLGDETLRHHVDDQPGASQHHEHETHAPSSCRECADVGSTASASPRFERRSRRRW
jgi:hypothetical protein